MKPLQNDSLVISFNYHYSGAHSPATSHQFTFERFAAVLRGISIKYQNNSRNFDAPINRIVEKKLGCLLSHVFSCVLKRECKYPVIVFGNQLKIYANLKQFAHNVIHFVKR